MANETWPPPSLKPVRFTSDFTEWNRFDWHRSPALAAAKPIIVDWYNGLPGSGALVLAGHAGTGKTHIARAIRDLFGPWRTAFVEEIPFFKKIQSTYGGKRGGQTEDQLMADLYTKKLLIYDDIGTYETSNRAWVLNIYNQIFNEWLTVQNKPLLLTTNLPMDDSEDNPGFSIEALIAARSYSRLCDKLADMRRYVLLDDLSDMRIQGLIERTQGTAGGGGGSVV